MHFILAGAYVLWPLASLEKSGSGERGSLQIFTAGVMVSRQKIKNHNIEFLTKNTGFKRLSYNAQEGVFRRRYVCNKLSACILLIRRMARSVHRLPGLYLWRDSQSPSDIFADAGCIGLRRQLAQELGNQSHNLFYFWNSSGLRTQVRKS